jgi:hypothetical protein
VSVISLRGFILRISLEIFSKFTLTYQFYG